MWKHSLAVFEGQNLTSRCSAHLEVTHLAGLQQPFVPAGLAVDSSAEGVLVRILEICLGNQSRAVL